MSRNHCHYLLPVKINSHVNADRFQDSEECTPLLESIVDLRKNQDQLCGPIRG
jgi:hypothetical protein